MADDYDPRNRRLNAQIYDLVGILDEHWHDLVHDTDHLSRKGKLRVVRSMIDQILEEPEWLEADLQPGAVESLTCWLEPESFTDPQAPVFLDEGPFDTSGPDAGRHFFATDTGKVSRLYEGEPIDPHHLANPLSRHGPWVYTLERRHVTAGETRMHVISANLFRQLAGGAGLAPGEDADDRHAVLCDPRGIGGGARTVRVADFEGPDGAMELAERLATAIDVRFLVARERVRHCTR